MGQTYNFEGNFANTTAVTNMPLTLSQPVKSVVQPRRCASRRSTQARAALKPQDFGKAAAVFATGLTLAAAANAATVKLGGDGGELAFVPSTLKISKGDKVDFVNNKGFPHNVVFDEDAIPSGANADALSHEDFLNGPGETVSSTFTVPGTYEGYCEPHQGAGMGIKITVG